MKSTNQSVDIIQNTEIKRLLIISEATFFENGTGINRTLINLFKDYPKDRLLIAAPENYLIFNPPAAEFEPNVMGITSRKSIPRPDLLPGRLKLWINQINLKMLENFGINEIKRISDFSPEVIMLCANTLECHLIAENITDIINVPFYLYHTDDLKELDSRILAGRSGKDLIVKLLKKASGWVMISDSLGSAYKQRYSLKPEKLLIVHNPVEIDPDTKNPGAEKIKSTDTFKIVYAGAVWQMHYDAIYLCAAAVKELRNEGHNIQLVLHTESKFWDMHKDVWVENEVFNGGYVSYKNIRSEFNKADLLLTGSSFNNKFKHLSFTSIQTKLTDYMAAGRAILSIGPEGCACNQFVKDWKCGLIFQSEDKGDLKKLLSEIMNQRELLQNFGNRGFEAAKLNFSVSTVNPRLYNFLSAQSEMDKTGNDNNISPISNYGHKSDKYGKTDQLEWAEVCKNLSKDSKWEQAIRYLESDEIQRGFTIQKLWSVLDNAWYELKSDFPGLKQNEFLHMYYQHPVWLLLGAFSETDKDTINDRLAAIRMISSVKPEKILDFGGGIGTACRLAALHIPTAKRIDLVDIGPFSETIRSHLSEFDKIRVIKEAEPPYDAVICTEVLEHLVNPVAAVVEINRLMKAGGSLAVSYSFAPGIACHLPHNFHLSQSMLWIIRSLGFGFYGFERRGSTVYSFIKMQDISHNMIRTANILNILSKYKFPIGKLLTAFKGI